MSNCEKSWRHGRNVGGRFLTDLTSNDIMSRLDYFDCFGGEPDLNAFELCKRYYPRLWDKSRVDALYAAGKLTEEEYREIVGEDDE